MSNLVAISDVTPGMVIVRITQQNGPVKIRKSGLVSSDAMIQGLSEMGVQEVEIDPAQTVEIAPETAPQRHAKTQTQALLRGDHDTSAKFDHALSDQFNRSLFLPTVQGLPSLWKVYTRQVLTFAVLLFGGAAIGFTAATHTLWWPTVAATFTTPQSSPPNQEVAAQPAPTTTDTAQSDTGNAASTPTEAVAKTSETDKDLIASQTDSASAAVPSQSSDTVDMQRNANDMPRNEKSEVATTTQGNAGADEPEEEGTVLNERPDNDKVSVSPELMARFNAAVEAMDKQATDPEPDPQTRVTVRNDLPRVDQLPVRLLTRLPTMNFSAHMYASRSSDRWVRVNGIQLGEGDWIDDRVQIVNIEAQQVILAFEDELFTMAALTDW